MANTANPYALVVAGFVAWQRKVQAVIDAKAAAARAIDELCRASVAFGQRDADVRRRLEALDLAVDLLHATGTDEKQLVLVRAMAAAERQGHEREIGPLLAAKTAAEARLAAEDRAVEAARTAMKAGVSIADALKEL